MRVRTLCIAVAVQLLATKEAAALDGKRGVAQYVQTHYETSDGLPHGLTNSVAQTPDGYLWAGSEEGLVRFDGGSFTTFDHRTTEGIPTNQFTALAVDRAGELWAGTRDRGLLHLVNGEFRAVVWEPGADGVQIRALAFDHDGDLWVGMRDRGLVRLHAGLRVTALGARDGLPSDDVRSVLAGADGTLWIGTYLGLAGLRDGRVVHGPPALGGIAIHALAEDRHGELWCATANGLAHVRGTEVERVGVDRLANREIRRILFDRDGNLWIGADGGASRMTPGGRIDTLAHPASPVLALFEDVEGNLWIGSERGLDRLRDGAVIAFGADEGVTDEAAFGIREDPAGAIWISSSGGLFRIAPGQTTATKIAVDRGTVYAIFADARGDVWVGARDGSIGRWHDDHFMWIGRRAWERVRAIVETEAGRWIGTDHGLFRLRGDQLDDAETVVPRVVVSAILPDASGGLWLGTEGRGLLHWNAGALVAIPAGGPPANSSVTTVQRDADGTLWAGSEGSGLWRLRDGRWFVFTSKDGMFDDLVWRILDDGAGNLWLSSNRGIWSVSRQQLEQRAAGLRATVDSVIYGLADGMRDRECNGAVDPSGWRTRDGRLWFPTGKGVAVIDPAHLDRPRAPDALIQGARVDGQPYPRGPRLVLPPGSSRLELAYTAPALRSPERLRFRYRLEGFDRLWNEAGAQRVAQYTNLAPGDYQFIVEASSDNTWGRAGTVAITLRPLFYQTRWFFVLEIAAIVLAIIAVPLVRGRRLRARARALDARVQEAVRELKVLSGLLPICAWCKKIRDDRGYWSKIEAYLGARTDAKFTHGICPECNEKVLAEEDHGHEEAPKG